MEEGLEKQQPTGESRTLGMAHREQETEELQCMIQKEKGMKSSGVNKATIKGLAAGGSMAGVATNKVLKMPTGSRHVNKRKKVMGGGIHRPPENKAGVSVKGILSELPFSCYLCGLGVVTAQARPKPTLCFWFFERQK